MWVYSTVRLEVDTEHTSLRVVRKTMSSFGYLSDTAEKHLGVVHSHVIEHKADRNINVVHFLLNGTECNWLIYVRSGVINQFLERFTES